MCSHFSSDMLTNSFDQIPLSLKSLKLCHCVRTSVVISLGFVSIPQALTTIIQVLNEAQKNKKKGSH